MSDRADPPPPRVDDAAGAGWTYATIAYLQQEARCPRCLSGRMDGSVCQTCFADLRGEWGGRMREASAAVVAALRNRQQTVLSLPTLPSAGAPSVAQTVPEAYHLPVTAAELARQTARAAQQTAPPEQQVSVQSVLAVTGAALLAVAAIVFTFLNPDLTDVGARTAIVAGVAVLFLSGGWLLARRSLRFSAETIGALGIVFAVLAGWALAAIVPDGVMTRLGAATATLVLSSLAVIAATRVRMRTWLWCGLVGIGITPAIAASAWSSPWSAILGSLGCAFSALLVLALIRRLEPGFRRPLAADRVTATILQLTALTVMLSVLVGLSGRSDSVPFAPVLVVAASAVLAALTAREFIPGFWSVAAGALAVAAAAAVPVQFDLGSESVYWIVALAPLAATAALVALTILPSMGALQRSRMLGGAWTLARATAIPAVLMLLVELLTTFRPVAGLGTDPWFGVSVVAALTITAGGSFALVRIARPLSVKNEAVFGASIAVVALHAIAACAWFAEPVRAAVALVLAAGLVAALSKRGPLRTVSARIRLPLILGSHTLLFYAAVVAWSTPWSQVAVSAGVVAALALLATIVPRTFRPVYVAAGFLYGLIVLGTALGLTGLDPTANLCITTSVGVLTAIAATMAKGMSFDTWVAVLASATIPFLVTVAMVIVARSGWTALPTAFTFVLALTIVLDRRERLHRTLRGVAAAALVPSLAVVIITLGAQILSGSASPVTLPIIAAIVAVAVPATRRIGALLAARGMPADHVAAVRLWIEVSGLVTGAIAILLAVIRVAAGAQTALLVFLILGVGAAATSLVARRSYGWWAAGACWTGALWSTLVLLGITSVELYLLPPAIVAVAIGAIAVGRGRRALPLFAVGLACAVAPSLVLLTVFGAEDAFPWRAVILLGAALGALLGGRLAGRRASTASLELPTLVVALVTAAAGSLQAVRYGWGLDSIQWPATTVMVPVLGLSLASAILATGAGWRLRRVTSSRLILAPALLLLLAGPWTANRPDAMPILTLWILTALLLGGMLVTTVIARRRTTSLPPVWLWFVLAWITAVVGWSMRELRVEAFSLPLGLALLACGVLGFTAAAGVPSDDTAADAAHRTATTWPLGFRGSWQTLAPGMIVLLLPSVLATATDPLTWRAVLVIAVALAAILVGSSRKLAALFILGLVVLPIENVIVFVVQIGHSIGALPWWITLATAGAVLLVLAVSSERKTSGVRSTAALLRDLR